MSLAWRFDDVQPTHTAQEDVRRCVDCGIPLRFHETERCTTHAAARRDRALDDVGRDIDWPTEDAVD